MSEYSSEKMIFSTDEQIGKNTVGDELKIGGNESVVWLRSGIDSSAYDAAACSSYTESKENIELY